MTISAPRSKSDLTKKQKDMIRTFFYHLFVGGLCLLMIYPIIWMVGSSLKGPSEIWTNVAGIIPEKFEWSNYATGWAGFGGTSFAVYFKNSLIYAGYGTVAVVFASAFVAYGFARINFKWRNFWFTCLMLTLMLPRQVLIIPQYVLFTKFGWVNTFLPLIVPRMTGSPFFIFLIMQFIRGLPRELDEAAEMDGANRFGIFRRIILPLAQPALITAAVFSFYWTWEDFLSPLIYLNDPKLYTVSLALRSMADPNSGTDWGAIFAMATLSLVPVFVLFIAFQKYIIQGIGTTGLKG